MNNETQGEVEQRHVGRMQASAIAMLKAEGKPDDKCYPVS